MVEHCGGLAVTVEVAARGRDDYAPAARKSFGAVGGVTEGLAGDCQTVEPGLELRRQRKIVHWRSDHYDIGVEKVVERLRAARRDGPKGDSALG
jgi:hypothetical protein